MPMPKTTEQFKKEVYDLVGNEYTVLGEYTGVCKKILIKHNICGNEYYATPNKFLSGRRCPKCANISRSKKNSHDTTWFKNKVYNLVGNEYTVLGEYTGYDNKILIRHNCEFCDNREFTMTPSLFIRGHRCEVCSNHKPTKESYKKIFTKKFNTDNSFKFLDIDIKNNRVLILHKKCNKTFYKSIKYLLSKKIKIILCPHCNIKSFGNIIVYNFLKKYKINFIPEASENNCIFKKIPLRFDFKIIINEKEYFYIEIDGIQHKKSIGYFGGEKDFEERKTRDNIKDNFCKKNNIKLFRIPYTSKISSQENIEEKLVSILDHYKLL